MEEKHNATVESTKIIMELGYSEEGAREIVLATHKLGMEAILDGKEGKVHALLDYAMVGMGVLRLSGRDPHVN